MTPHLPQCTACHPKFRATSSHLYHFKMHSHVCLQYARLGSSCCMIRRLHGFTQELSLTTCTALHEANLNTVIQTEFSQLKVFNINSGCLSELVCGQFQGHTNLEVLCSTNDWITPGALNCPQLKKFTIEGQQGGLGPLSESINPAFESRWVREQNGIVLRPHERRDLSVILENLSQLHYLSINNPTIWTYDMTHAFYSDSLKTLKLTSLCYSTLASFVTSLKYAAKPLLPNLEELLLDLDYLELPRRAIRYLSTSSPRLQSLKIKYAYFEDAFLPDVCHYLPKLSSLRLSHCKIKFESDDWAHLIIYMASYLSDLFRLSLSSCTLDTTDVEPSLFSFKPFEKYDQLRRLKIIEPSFTKCDASIFFKILTFLPKLTDLRLQFTDECIPVDPSYLQTVKKSFSNLNNLELRFQGPMLKTMMDIPMPHLKNLTLSCSPFQQNIIMSCDKDILVSLDLKQISNAPVEDIHLPNLRHLTIYGKTKYAGSVTLDILRKVGMHSDKLESVCLVALTTNTTAFPTLLLQQFSGCTPRLVSFITDHFTYSLDSLSRITHKWQFLRQLTLAGPQAVGTAAKWKSSLSDFLDLHRRMCSLVLDVSGNRDEYFSLIRGWCPWISHLRIRTSISSSRAE